MFFVSHETSDFVAKTQATAAPASASAVRHVSRLVAQLWRGVILPHRISDARSGRPPKSFDMVTSTASLKGTSTASPNQVQGGKGYDLKAEDFIKMMITQLQNQDPMEPAKNEQLLSQMSQIGQLESSTQLQTSLKSMVLQNNIGAAGNLIGKMVNGLDEKGAPLKGLVNSVRVEDGNVALELDNGKSLAMANVTSIATSAPAHAG
jgi:flagellar basal-body rod modification protein FlgD